jgi:lambda family phage tail tape measure protein
MSQAATKIVIQADDRASRVFQKVAQDAGTLTRKISSLGSTANAALSFLGIGAGGYAVEQVFSSSLNIDRLEKAYASIYGSAQAGNAQLREMYELSNRLGLQFQNAAAGAKGFFAAAQGSDLADQADDIFESVTMAMTALGASSDDTSGALRALGQMISKGKVQAEELRGQLGERLPGAFQLAAKAMGMTTAELDKFMADGKLTANELLPRLAKVLRDEYGAAALQAAQGLQGMLNRVSTELERLKASLVDSQSAGQSLGGLADTMKTLADNGDQVGAVIGTLVSGLDEAIVAFVAYKVATSIAATQTGKTATAILTGNASLVSQARLSLVAAENQHLTALASQELARANLARAVAEEKAYASASKDIGIIMQQEAAFRRLIAAQNAYAASSAQVAASQRALAAAQAGATLSGRTGALGRSAIGGIGSALTNSLKGVVNFLGGPLGAALTAASVGVYAFYSAESDAEKMAKRFGSTLEEVKANMERLGAETKETANATLELTMRQRNLAIAAQRAVAEKAQREAEAANFELQETLNELRVFGASTSFSNMYDANIGAESNIYKKRLDDIVDAYKRNEIGAADVTVAIKTIQTEMENAGIVIPGFDRLLDKMALQFGNLADALKLAEQKMYDFKKATHVPTDSRLGFGDERETAIFKAIEADFAKTREGQEKALRKAIKDADDRGKKLVGNTKAVVEARKQNEAVINKLEDDLKKLRTPSRTRGSGGKSLIEQVNDDIKRLTLSTQDFEKYQLGQKIDQLRGKGVPQSKLDELRAASEASWAKKAKEEADKAAKETLQTQNSFWQEYVNLGGRNQESYLQAQDTALRQQVELYRRAGISIIQLEEYAYLKRLSYATDWESGVIRGLENYAREAQNAAKNAEQAITTAFSSAEDALVQFTTTGKVSFSDMVNSMIADMMRMAVRQSVTGPLASALSQGLGSLLNTQTTVTPLYSAKGNVFPGGTGLHDYINQIIDRPTAFAFAKGGVPNLGIMGEGVEAVMPLIRDPSGNLGVRAQAAAPVVNVNVINNTQARVETQTSQDAGGNLTLDVIIDEIDARMSKRIADGSSQLGNAFDRTRGTNRAAQLYRK